MIIRTETGESSLVEALQAAILQGLYPAAPSGNPELARYRKLLADYPLRGGKLVRGLLTLLSTMAHGGTVQDGLVPAATVELFQSWVLIHDDIEDDSLLRRGQPALHRQVGMPVALNVGDGLHVHMWQRLLESQPAPAVVAEFLHTIARTAEGQHLDLAWVAERRFDVSEDEYLGMVRLKTARYTVVTPLRLGALVLGLEPASEFISAGLDLGAAFQIRDDVLNLTARDESRDGYGKEAAGDLTEAKRTLILAHFFATATADTAAEARERLGKPTEERTAADVNWLLAAITSTRSIEYAQSVAENMANSSLRSLTEVLSALPGPDASQRVISLLRSLVSRQR